MATRTTYPFFKALTAAGTLGIGYKLYTYKAGTATALTTYTDYAGTIPHTNPIILDTVGEAELFITESAKLTLTDADGNIIPGWPVDNVYQAVGTASEVTYTPSGIVTSTNVQGAIDEVIVELAAVKSLASQLAADSGVGQIRMFTTSTVPTGYLECDGSAVSRATYAALFAIIADYYGAGDGSTTFNVPDYRGRFLRGWAHGQTTDPDKASRTDRGDGTAGDVVGSKQGYLGPAHTHTVANNIVLGGAYYDMGNNGYETSITNATSSTSSSGGNESRPININVMFCIVY